MLKDSIIPTNTTNIQTVFASTWVNKDGNFLQVAKRERKREVAEPLLDMTNAFGQISFMHIDRLFLCERYFLPRVCVGEFGANTTTTSRPLMHLFKETIKAVPSPLDQVSQSNMGI